jgi:hypothetical protein
MSITVIRLICTLTFLIGVSVDVMIRAGHAKRSDVNTHPTRWSFVTDNFDVILARLFWSSIVFGIWLFKPDWISTALKWFDVPDKYANWITVTPNPASAAGGGILSDYGLDWAQAVVAKKNIPVLTALLKAKLPQYDESVVNVKKIAEKDNKDSKDEKPDEPEF